MRLGLDPRRVIFRLPPFVGQRWLIGQSIGLHVFGEGVAVLAACRVKVDEVIVDSLAVVVIVAFRNYKYEQELDSLLWKVDPKDLKVILTS